MNAPAPAPTPAPAWHAGVDPAILGHWQNKNYDLTDPGKVAIAATQAALEAQKFVGAPPEQLLRLPKDANDAAGIAAMRARLGVPNEAKDYDFAGIQRAGKDLEASFSDAMRAAMHQAGVTKDAAAGLARAFAKHLDDSDAAAKTIIEGELAKQKAALKASWGTKAEENLLTAKQGARRLGVDNEALEAFGNVLGYDKAMEIFRMVGAGTNEDTFVDGGGGKGGPPTAESAQARMNELQNDRQWSDRLMKGDAAAKREFQALMEQIAGVTA